MNQDTDIRELLFYDLNSVEKPARYTGGEYGAIKKDPDQVTAEVTLAYPDVYEVGMSHLGSHILYHEINRREDALAERVYLPWPDMEKVLRRRELALYGLESGRPVRFFDILGITLQYELTYTGVLNLLSLSGIPLTTQERREAFREGRTFPLVVAGGPGAFNPEPLWEYLDVVALGDGELLVHDLLDELVDLKGNAPGPLPREALLERLAEKEGFYLPWRYSVRYRASGTVEAVEAQEGLPARVRRRVAPDLDRISFPTRPPVPFVDVVHDRAVVEVFRGCTRGCRFCQAGMVYRPVRERSEDVVVDLARETVDRTGHSEVSLVSLSSCDYTSLPEAMERLRPELAAGGVGLSLPSLRVDTFSVETARSLGQVRRSGLTLAPEAGTQRLRDVINKNVSATDFHQTVATAFEAGWDTLKLYFMIGLPTETEEDIDGIVDMVKECFSLYRRHGPRKGRPLKVNVSLAGFVPKPHTPFQWVGQEPPELLRSRASRVQRALGPLNTKVSYTDPLASRLEAVFARGDRRLSGALATAFGKGARFDAWTEHFSPRLWDEAFRENGIDAGFYAHRTRDKTEVFPWDHIDAGVDRGFLCREYERALEGSPTPDCRWEGCPGCGACRPGELENRLGRRETR